MWILFAFSSAFFAGITAILSKIGIKNTDSHLATAIRTLVVCFFAWILVFITKGYTGIRSIDPKTLFFLTCSGLSTGASWICYFKALQLSDVNKVTPIDKSSTLLTILLSALFLGESITLLKGISIVLIGFGTFLMIEKKEITETSASQKSWFIYAVLSAIFASLTAILGKVGIHNIDSNLGTAIRTIVILILAWAIVLFQKKLSSIKEIDKKSWLFLFLSGLSTGLSWMSYYKALQQGKASIVVPIDKLSILITFFFAWIILKEKVSAKSLLGLLLLTGGTLLLLF